MFHWMKGKPIGHCVMYSPPIGGTSTCFFICRGSLVFSFKQQHIIMFSWMSVNPKWHCIVYSQQKEYPKGHFIKFSHTSRWITDYTMHFLAHRSTFHVSLFEENPIGHCATYSLLKWHIYSLLKFLHILNTYERGLWISLTPMNLSWPVISGRLSHLVRLIRG